MKRSTKGKSYDKIYTKGGDFIEIRTLQYFLVVAREENITKAAEILHVTQPTLSRQIMQLEEELACTLFIRGKTKMTLTEDGVLLRSRAQEMIDLAEKTKKELSDKCNLVGGTIYIGAGELYSVNYLINIVTEFKKKYPEVRFDFFTGNADIVKEMIDKGLLDIGLVSEPADITKYEYKHTPIKERWGVWMTKNSPLSQKDSIKAKDLLDKSIILSRREIVQNTLRHWFGDDYDKLNIVATYDLAYNVKFMVENNLGYALGLDNLFYDGDESNLCFRPIESYDQIGTIFIWKKHQLFSRAATKFINEIKLK